MTAEAATEQSPESVAEHLDPPVLFDRQTSRKLLSLVEDALGQVMPQIWGAMREKLNSEQSVAAQRALSNAIPAVSEFIENALKLAPIGELDPEMLKNLDPTARLAQVLVRLDAVTQIDLETALFKDLLASWDLLHENTLLMFEQRLDLLEWCYRIRKAEVLPVKRAENIAQALAFLRARPPIEKPPAPAQPDAGVGSHAAVEGWKSTSG